MAQLTRAERLARPISFEELDHTADAGVRVRGATPEATLARLVLAFGELVSGGVRVPCVDERRLTVPAGDAAAMAVDVLRELLYWFEEGGVIPQACDVLGFDPNSGVELRVELGAYDAEKHVEGLVMKAVTLHAARFEPEDAGYVAEVVFDV